MEVHGGKRLDSKKHQKDSWLTASSNRSENGDEH
jgi:hypothetical protein